MAISLQSIRRERASRPPIIVEYGPPGVGKTTWAAGAPGAIFIRTEDGLGNIEADAFPLATSFADVMEALRVLAKEEHAFRWVVLDSLSALEPLIWSAVAQAEGKRNVEDLGFGKGYVIATDYWRQMFDALMWLATEKGIGSILIAHAEVQRYEAPDVDAYDRAQIKLHKRAFGLVYERADVIGYAAPRVMVRKENLGRDQTRNHGISTGERLLHLVERPAYVAKNRYSLPETLPLNWQAFEAALAASVTPAALAALNNLPNHQGTNMANLTGLVDLNASPESQFAALPSGEYPALITDSSIKQTKSGTGSYLELTYQIVDGAYRGRQLWARINLTNPNATAVSIGQQHLAQIRHATGQMQLSDSQQLHNIPHLIRVEYKPPRDQYSESNEVREYKAIAGGAPAAKPAQQAPAPQQAPAAAQAGGLPWQRNAA